MFNRIRKLNVYYKHMLLIFVVTCLPMAIIAACSYWIGVSRIEAEVKTSHRLQLNKISSSLEDNISRLEMLGNQWSFNPIFAPEWIGGDLRLKYNETRELFASLRILQEANPLIENAVIYIRDRHLLVSEQEGIASIEEPDRQSVFAKLMDQRTAISWQVFDSLPLKYRSSTGVALVHLLRDSQLDPYGAIMLFIGKSALDDMLYPLNPDGSGAAFIMRQDGALVTDGRSVPPDNAAPLNESIRSEVIHRAMEPADFAYKYNRTDYSVSVGEFKRPGWIYVVATPISALTAPVLLMLKLSLAACALGLLVAIGLSWLASRQMYRPIGRMFNLVRESEGGAAQREEESDEFAFIEYRWTNLKQESRELRLKLERSSRQARDGFLRQWIQGHLAHLSEEELVDRIGQNGWDAQENQFAVILVRLSDMTDRGGRFGKGDEQLASFAAANIAEEVVRMSGTPAEIVNFFDLSIAVLLFVPAEWQRETVKKELFQLAEVIISQLSSFLGMRVTVGVGKPVQRAVNIHQSLEETRQMISFRDIDKKEQILDMDNLLPQSGNPVHYPFEAEHELIQFIRMGMEDEAVGQLGRFVSSLKLSRGQELLFRQGMLQLLGSILHALLKAGVDSGSLYRSDDLYEQLIGLVDADVMQQWFEDVIVRPFTGMMRDNREKLLEQLVDKVVHIIHESYPLPISLDSCAEEVGIMSYNLSKVFKYFTGHNFIDYLTNVRIAKAKELLIGSDLKMNEIAERVGYQPTYFVRIFKKAEGVTPGKYRSNYMRNANKNAGER
ncbi:helix-turn-helix domain-containing protein [Cohnella fermenti]|uniref:helix-turn-helix domain-containing protein n=1 Tax=Cohnella fermenti TaxID=2565925 RepID=UPI001454E1A4|nr:helix-turn-helix domain-containing protein [Cohnella fermenti]